MVPKIVQKMVYEIKDIQEATLHVFNFEDDNYLNTPPDSKGSLLPAEGIKELMGTISTLSHTVAQLSSIMFSSAPASPHVTIQRPPPRQQCPQQNQSTPGGAQSDAPQYAHIPLNPAPDHCIFCGDEEHYVHNCHIVEKYIHTGGRGGITQGVSFEFFESFLLIYSHNTHWVNFEFFQKSLTTLIKTYSQGNFRNRSKKALHFAQQVILSKNPKVLS